MPLSSMIRGGCCRRSRRHRMVADGSVSADRQGCEMWLPISGARRATGGDPGEGKARRPATTSHRSMCSAPWASPLTTARPCCVMAASPSTSRCPTASPGCGNCSPAWGARGRRWSWWTSRPPSAPWRSPSPAPPGDRPAQLVGPPMDLRQTGTTNPPTTAPICVHRSRKPAPLRSPAGPHLRGFSSHAALTRLSPTASAPRTRMPRPGITHSSWTGLDTHTTCVLWDRGPLASSTQSRISVREQAERRLLHRGQCAVHGRRRIAGTIGPFIRGPGESGCPSSTKKQRPRVVA